MRDNGWTQAVEWLEKKEEEEGKGNWQKIRSGMEVKLRMYLLNPGDGHLIPKMTFFSETR